MGFRPPYAKADNGASFLIKKIKNVGIRILRLDGAKILSFSIKKGRPFFNECSVQTAYLLLRQWLGTDDNILIVFATTKISWLFCDFRPISFVIMLMTY